MIFNLKIIKIENQIFSGLVEKIIVTGSEGEISITGNHSHLITNIKPGSIRILKYKNLEEDYMYISGGVLEIRPKEVLILADTVIREEDLDQEKTIKSVEKLKKYIQYNRRDYNEINIELSKELAKLKIIELIKVRNFNKKIKN